ncbi:MAG: FAD-dependent oxidoreductase [Hungatella hathewayi]
MSAVSKITGGDRAEVVVYEKGAICSCGTLDFPTISQPGSGYPTGRGGHGETLRTSGVTAHCRHEVLSVACDRKQVTVRNLDNGQVFDDHYDKLVIAAGSHNLIPDVPGVEKVGVQVLKTVEDVIFLREFTKTPFVHDITIIGGSFAGLELAKAFLKMGRSVRIIEKEDQLLPTFDREVSAMIQRELEESGVKIHLRETLRGFTGGTFIEKTETSRGSYDTDLAMMAVGVAPNTGCLTGSGISMTPQGEIIINKSMEQMFRTSTPWVTTRSLEVPCGPPR